MKILSILMLVGIGSINAFAHARQNQERALIAYMRVLPGTEAQFLQAAEDVIEQSRKETGNITYQLHQSVTNPQQFVFYELFDNNDELQYHRGAKHTKAFIQKTKPITVEFTLEEYAPTGELPTSAN